MYATKFEDLKVGMTVRHKEGDFEGGEEAIITWLDPEGDGNSASLGMKLTKAHGGLPAGLEVGRYFRGITGGPRWEILHDPNAMPQVGDTIVITNRIEGVVIDINDYGVELNPGGLYELNPRPLRGYARTWEITKKALPPWQPGDIVYGSGCTGIRQADGTWINADGAVTIWTDDSIDANQYIKAVVRGGVRQ